MPAGRNKSMTWFCENTIHSTTSIYNQSSFQKQNNDPMSLAQEYWPKCHSHSPSTTGAHRRGLILPKCCLLQSSTITCHRQCHAKKKRLRCTCTAVHHRFDCHVIHLHWQQSPRRSNDLTYLLFDTSKKPVSLPFHTSKMSYFQISPNQNDVEVHITRQLEWAWQCPAWKDVTQ